MKKISTLLIFILIFSPITAARSVEAPGRGPVVSGGSRISLDLRGMDIVEALKILSSKGNLNMVIGGNIQGRVTLFLKDVEIQDALEIILISNGLAYDKKGDILYVMTQRDYEQIYGETFGGKKDVKILTPENVKAADLAKSLEQAKTRLGKIIVDDASNSVILMDSASAVTQMESIAQKLDRPMANRMFELKYAKAADIKTRVADMLTKGIGSMQADERTNKISVTDISSKISEIEKVILAFDEKLPQVLIEAKIVQVTLSDAYKLGVDWDSVFKAFHRNVRMTGTFSFSDFSTGTKATVGSVGQTNYYSLIQALKTVGDTNLLSSPRITALNNQEAKILVGESRPYATNTVVTPGSGPTTTASTLSFLDVGVKLYVTPTINKDGFVTMKIKPEVSAVTSDYEYGTPTTKVPIVSTTQAETSITVKDGSTIIIAGLVKDERSSSQDKVPFAGDLPVIGNMFKKTNNSVKKQELVIFITPHIISGDDDYLEVPATPPVNEDKFSVSEGWGNFERRDRKTLDPTYFKNPKTPRKTAAQSTPEPGITKISQPGTVEEYYYMVKDKILNNIHFTDSKGRAPKGRIQLSFRLGSAGRLASAPLVRTSTNADLDNPAMDAVKKSAPFPQFPPTIKQPEKEFLIDFIFE